MGITYGKEPPKQGTRISDEQQYRDQKLWEMLQGMAKGGGFAPYEISPFPTMPNELQRARTNFAETGAALQPLASANMLTAMGGGAQLPEQMENANLLSSLVNAQQRGEAMVPGGAFTKEYAETALPLFQAAQLAQKSGQAQRMLPAMQYPEQMLSDVIGGYKKYEYEPGFEEQKRQNAFWGQLSNWLGGTRSPVSGGELGGSSAAGSLGNEALWQDFYERFLKKSG